MCNFPIWIIHQLYAILTHSEHNSARDVYTQACDFAIVVLHRECQ